MTKRIQIKLLPDGQIEAMTDGVKGSACLEYIAQFEELLDAKIVDSNFTAEYREVEETLPNINQQQTLDQNF